MSINSDELNYLVYRYLQESGFTHSAFTFAYESLVAKSSVAGKEIPPGALVSFIQKGLQYVEIEAHLSEDGANVLNGQPLSLLNAHLCQSKAAKAGPVPRESEEQRRAANGDDGTLSRDGGNCNGGQRCATAKDGYRDGAKRMSKTAPEIPEHDVSVLRGHGSEVFICAWSPKANLLASGSGDSTARIWGVPPGASGVPAGDMASANPIELRHVSSSAQTSKDVTTIDWSGDGTKLATGSYDGQARVWNTKGDLLATLTSHKGPIFSLKWNTAGDLLLSGSVDKTAIVWDAATGVVKQQFAFHYAPTLDVDWRNRDTFATCSTDKLIHVCKVGDATPVRTFKGHRDEVNAIKWDPTGTLLASCSDDYTAKIWSLDSGHNSCAHDLCEHTKEIYTIRWSPTGPGTDNSGIPMLASASFDATVKLWDVEAGRCVHTLAEHSDPVYSVAWSPNGRFLASGSFDRCLHIWSVKDGTLVKSFRGGGGIFEVCWNAAGDKLAACFSDNTVVVLDYRTF